MMQGPRVGERVRRATGEVEAEVARFIAYVNDEVVPEVRRGSSVALRAVSAQLVAVAEHLDRAPAPRREAPASADSGGFAAAGAAAKGASR